MNAASSPRYVSNAIIVLQMRIYLSVLIVGRVRGASKARAVAGD